jgi:flagella basal body P-ring formation protein FlgA
VLLRSEEANIRLQLAAVAEENGGVGDRVRVRLLVGSGGSFEGKETRRVTGIVRGPGEVEMEQ